MTNVWLVANMDNYKGTFKTKREAIEHFAGHWSTRRYGCYEIVGTMDEPNRLTGLFIFRPERAEELGLQWAVDKARYNGDIPHA